MITRQLVTQRILAYLNGTLTLAALVDWAEKCFIEGGFTPDEDIDLLTDIVMYLAGADRPAFPLTWDILSDFLTRLGSPVRVVPLEPLSA